MSQPLSPVFRQRFFDSNGDPLAGGKVYTYVAGTTTPKATYTDSTGSSANTNPIILDANGECDIWMGSGYYKIVLKNSADVTQWTVDLVTSSTGSGTNTILWGSGAPGAGLGNNDDFYIDTAITKLYGPKTAGAWGSGTSLIGPAGTPGAITAIDTAIGTTPATPGMSVSGGTLTLQPADNTHAGLVSILAQTFKGIKTFTDDIVASAKITLSSYLERSSATGITAFAGGGQGSATALTKDVNRVTTVAASNDSVKLPAAVAGRKVVVINDGASTMAIFPASGESIDALAANASVVLASAKNSTFVCAATGVWKQAGGSSSASSSGSGGINYISNPDAETDTSGWVTYGDSFGVAFTDVGDIVTDSGNGLTTGQVVCFSSITSTTGISINTAYYVIYVSSNTYQLASSLANALAGTALALTTNGIGVALHSIPLTGASGSSSSTFTRSTSSPLRGTGSFLWTKSAANRMGEGFSYDFTIDSSDAGKVIQASLEYKIASGTYADDDMTFFIYDKTNANFIPLTPYKIKNSTIIEKFFMEFQTATSSTSYRLICHTSSISSSAYSLQFDTWNVGPQAKLYGSTITDVGSVVATSTGSWSANTTYSNKLYREGDRLKGWIHLALAGAPTSAALTVNLPYTIDTTKLAGSTGVSQDLGKATIVSAGTKYVGKVLYNSTTSVAIYSAGSTLAAVTQAAPGTFTNGDSVNIEIDVPVLGWGSSQILSTDAITRPVAARAYVSSGAVSTSSSPINFDTIDYDTYGMISTGVGTWKATAKVPGYYKVTASLYTGGATTNLLLKNGTAHSALGTATVNSLSSASTELFLKTGDYIEMRPSTTITTSAAAPATLAQSCWIAIELLQGPSQIMASESISAKYSNTAGTTLTKSASNIVPFATKDWDSHGAFVTDTFTALISGEYLFVTGLVIAAGATWASGDYVSVAIQKNGVDNAFRIYPQLAQTAPIGIDASFKLKLIAGETAKINVNPTKAAAGNVTLNTTAGYNTLEVTRIGNY